jgi:hypothetical protein
MYLTFSRGDMTEGDAENNVRDNRHSSILSGTSGRNITLSHITPEEC